MRLRAVRRGTPIACLLVLGALRAASSSASSPDPLRAGLDLLHQGQFEIAEQAFTRAALASPADPQPHLLIAFSYVWRIFQDRSEAGYDAYFRLALEEAMQRARARLAADPDDADAQAALGTAYVFDFCVQGLRHNYLRAAQAARRGHKILEALVERHPGQWDAYFALGGYNYYADRVPAIARGLLFIPRGDAALGLAQLRTVASSANHFHNEARLLLALICGSREERCYAAAEDHLRSVLAESPGSPLILASLASLKMRLGFYAEAITHYEAALAAAREPTPERERQRRILRLLLAEAFVADWRLGRAESLVAEAMEGPGSSPERERDMAARVRGEIRQKRGLPEWRIEEALHAWDEGREEEALDILRDSVTRFPLEPLPRFLRARLSFLQGRFAGADRELELVVALRADKPAWMEGWIALYRGLALRALGDEKAALDQFRRAAGQRRFKSTERGSLEMEECVPGTARCVAGPALPPLSAPEARESATHNAGSRDREGSP